MARATELRDDPTFWAGGYNHSERVARALNLAGNEILDVYAAEEKIDRITASQRFMAGGL